MNIVLKKNQISWLVAAIVLVIPLMVWSFNPNPPLGETGAPGESTCTGRKCAGQH